MSTKSQGYKEATTAWAASELMPEKVARCRSIKVKNPGDHLGLAFGHAVNSPLTDAPNSGPLLNNGHCLMYQLNSLWFMYSRNT